MILEPLIICTLGCDLGHLVRVGRAWSGVACPRRASLSTCTLDCPKAQAVTPRRAGRVAQEGPCLFPPTIATLRGGTATRAPTRKPCPPPQARPLSDSVRRRQDDAVNASRHRTRTGGISTDIRATKAKTSQRQKQQQQPSSGKVSISTCSQGSTSLALPPFPPLTSRSSSILEGISLTPRPHTIPNANRYLHNHCYAHAQGFSAFSAFSKGYHQFGHGVLIADRSSSPHTLSSFASQPPSRLVLLLHRIGLLDSHQHAR